MKNYLVMAGVAVGVFVVGMAFVRPVQNVVNQVTKTEPLGAVAGPEVLSQYFSVGGQREWRYNSSSFVASTTPATILGPAATTTLQFYGCRIDLASSTATTITLARATVPNATTTLLASASLGAGAQGSVVASTTASGGVNPNGFNVISPNTYFTLGVANAISVGDTSATGFTPRGSCSLKLIEI